MTIALPFQIVPIYEVPMKDVVHSSKHSTIFVVDDEPMVADTLTTILNRAGFHATAAHSAEQALELAVEARPSLLISDFSMPDMNGVELAMVLLETNPACKILLFSGNATNSDLGPAVDAGYDFRLLRKPVHPTEMLRQVARALGLPEHPAHAVRMADILPMRRSA
jgi:DNA-binding NtrC family response regulator